LIRVAGVALGALIVVVPAAQERVVRQLGIVRVARRERGDREQGDGDRADHDQNLNIAAPPTYSSVTTGVAMTERRPTVAAAGVDSVFLPALISLYQRYAANPVTAMPAPKVMRLTSSLRLPAASTSWR